jgi:transglutaminase-like putative cysteine protease
MKKFVSLLLALVLIMTCAPAAFAALPEGATIDTKVPTSDWNATVLSYLPVPPDASYLAEPEKEIKDFIAGKIKATDDRGRLLETVKLVASTIKYDQHYDWKTSRQDAVVVLKNGVAICAGYVNLTVALLHAQNIPATSLMVVLGFDSPLQSASDNLSTYDHAIVAAYIDGKWVTSDPTGAGAYGAFDENYALLTDALRDTTYVIAGETTVSWFNHFGDSRESCAATSARLAIDGQLVDGFSAVVYRDTNYIGVRDLARAFQLYAKNKQFAVNYGGIPGIALLPGIVYTPTGDELNHKILKDNIKSGSASYQSAHITIFGVRQRDVESILISGYNYIRLRSLLELLDVSVDYDAKTKTILIDTSRPYGG